jgi:hypothetical protein
VVVQGSLCDYDWLSHLLPDHPTVINILIIIYIMETLLTVAAKPCCDGINSS